MTDKEKYSGSRGIVKLLKEMYPTVYDRLYKIVEDERREHKHISQFNYRHTPEAKKKRAEYAARYYQLNKEKVLAKAKEYRERTGYYCKSKKKVASNDKKQ